MTDTREELAASAWAAAQEYVTCQDCGEQEFGEHVVRCRACDSEICRRCQVTPWPGAPDEYYSICRRCAEIPIEQVNAALERELVPA